VFSIIMVVSWLTLGPLVAWLFMRKRNRRMNTAAAFNAPAAAPAPPVYPYLATPEQPWADLVGLWQFKSAARWVGVVIGVVFAIGTLQFPFPMNILYSVPPALIAFLSVLRPSRAAQTCTVAPNLAVTLGRGDREFPLDLDNYRYIRTHTSQVRYGDNFPSMVVFDRDSPPGFGTLMSSMLFPRADDGRIVLFHSRWYDAKANIISPHRIDDFFLDMCRRAGYEPRMRKTWFTRGRLAWSAGPNWS
jgi:hypothetical protein